VLSIENVLIRKLAHFGPLSPADREALQAALGPSWWLAAGSDLIKEGDAPKAVFLILEGLACRYKIQANGARTIMAYLLPGDLCDQHVFVLKAMDHSIGCISRCHVATISRQSMLAIVAEHPAVARALWWATLVDEATLREWLVNVGSREGPLRVAHLLCELLLRLQAVGLATADSYTLPITQTELADTVGLSSIHVNRVLKTLRERELITWTKSEIKILDVPGLKSYSDFNPNYLHL
jgi:CRP-like cAMP-binding protein